MLSQGQLEQVTSLCTDRSYTHVVLGDSAGHIRVWDIRGGLDISTPDTLRASFKQVPGLHVTSSAPGVVCFTPA